MAFLLFFCSSETAKNTAFLMFAAGMTAEELAALKQEVFDGNTFKVRCTENWFAEEDWMQRAGL